MRTLTVKAAVKCCVCLWISDQSGDGGSAAHLQVFSGETRQMKDQCWRWPGVVSCADYSVIARPRRWPGSSLDWKDSWRPLVRWRRHVPIRYSLFLFLQLHVYGDKDRSAIRDQNQMVSFTQLNLTAAVLQQRKVEEEFRPNASQPDEGVCRVTDNEAASTAILSAGEQKLGGSVELWQGLNERNKTHVESKPQTLKLDGLEQQIIVGTEKYALTYYNTGKKYIYFCLWRKLIMQLHCRRRLVYPCDPIISPAKY